MLANTTPNELEWIENFLGLQGKLHGNDLESIRNFSILWNLFEGLVCNRSASVGRLEGAVSNLQHNNQLNIADYDSFLQYFTNRYIENDEINFRFDRLRLRANDRRELVEGVLKGIETDPQSVLLAILIIVYRYRNNLFHGEKNIRDLPNQTDNFRNANQLLMVFMEKWKEAKS